jgi:hypothetical protein
MVLMKVPYSNAREPASPFFSTTLRLTAAGLLQGAMSSSGGGRVGLERTMGSLEGPLKN